MKAKELARVRRLARPAPYVGYVESDAAVGEISYFFPGMVDEKRVPKPHERLLAIQLSREFANPANAHAAWREAVVEAGQHLTGHPNCFKLGGQPNPSLFMAVWGSGEKIYAVSFAYTREPAGRQPAKVMIRVGLVRLPIDWEAVTCSSLEAEGSRPAL